MSIKDKYIPVLDLMSELKTEKIKIWEERGTLNIRGTAKDDHGKKLILNKVNEVNIEEGWDIDIRLEVKK